MIRTLRLQHMAIKVRDLERSICFYRDVLGFQLRSKHKEGTHPETPYGSAFMYLDEFHHQLAIFSVPRDWVCEEGEDTVPRRDVGLHHLAFQVSNQKDFDEAVSYVKSREDVEVVWGPLRLDDTNGLWGGHEAIFFLDPDGNRIEVFHDPDLYPESKPAWVKVDL